MNKGIITLCASVGGTVGGYLPVLLGTSSFGGWSLLGAFVGGVAGIWVGVKVQQ
jgi:hypothetical protein